MKKLWRLLPLAAVATFALGSGAVGASAAGGGGGGGFGGNMTITVASTGTLSSDGNTLSLQLSFTCDPSPASTRPPGVPPAFSGFIFAQVQQVQGKEVAFGGGGNFIPTATCNGTTVNTATLVVHPNLGFGGPGGPGGPASPPFKAGKAIVQGGGNVCDMNSAITPPPPPPGIPPPPPGTFHFCDFGGISPTLVMLKN